VPRGSTAIVSIFILIVLVEIMKLDLALEVKKEHSGCHGEGE
jgi:hypothetical protein